MVLWHCALLCHYKTGRCESPAIRRQSRMQEQQGVNHFVHQFNVHIRFCCFYEGINRTRNKTSSVLRKKKREAGQVLHNMTPP